MFSWQSWQFSPPWALWENTDASSLGSMLAWHIRQSSLVSAYAIGPERPKQKKARSPILPKSINILLVLPQLHFAMNFIVLLNDAQFSIS
jgi:hypothetical protein